MTQPSESSGLSFAGVIPRSIESLSPIGNGDEEERFNAAAADQLTDVMGNSHGRRRAQARRMRDAFSSHVFGCLEQKQAPSGNLARETPLYMRIFQPSPQVAKKEEERVGRQLEELKALTQTLTQDPYSLHQCRLDLNTIRLNLFNKELSLKLKRARDEYLVAKTKAEASVAAREYNEKKESLLAQGRAFLSSLQQEGIRGDHIQVWKRIYDLFEMLRKHPAAPIRDHFLGRFVDGNQTDPELFSMIKELQEALECTLVLQKERLRVNFLELADLSPYFYQLVFGAFNEAAAFREEKTLFLKDISKKELGFLLQLQSKEVVASQISYELHLSLFEYADYFHCLIAKEEIEQYISLEIDHNTWWEWCYAALSISSGTLKKRCLSFHQAALKIGKKELFRLREECESFDEYQSCARSLQDALNAVENQFKRYSALEKRIKDADELEALRPFIEETVEILQQLRQGIQCANEKSALLKKELEKPHIELAARPDYFINPPLPANWRLHPAFIRVNEPKFPSEDSP